jgi:cation diffusion facilitator family transporter
MSKIFSGQRGPSPPLSQFPPAISLPEAVERARSQRTRHLLRVTCGGILVRLLVIGMELAGVWLLGHALLLVDALATAGDVATSLVILLAVRLAGRPPDQDHPFGHGRYEPLAGLQLGVLICALGGWLLLRHAWAALREPAAGEVHAWVCAIPLVAAALLEGCYHVVRRAARQENSTALRAEAYHFRVDAATSLLAAAGLLIAALAPSVGHLVDHLGAVLLAGIMAGLGVMAVRENLHQLVDRVPSEECFERVKTSAEKVPGVRGVEKVRIQTAGPDAHVDIDIEVDPGSLVSASHRIAQRVRAQIQTDWPAVRDVVVHVEPYYEGDH